MATAGVSFSTDWTDRRNEIVNLMRATFAASDGADEGDLVSKLTADMLDTVPRRALVVCQAIASGEIVGCILFSPLNFEHDARQVTLLAPVAVRTDMQRRGIGQRLLRFGLGEMRRRGCDVAVTYGDPAYYPKVGFAQVSEETVPPPFPLSLPHGWQAVSLTDQPLTPLKGACHCVEAFDDAAYW